MDYSTLPRQHPHDQGIKWDPAFVVLPHCGAASVTIHYRSRNPKLWIEMIQTDH
jgi:hypothetical protein